jgi:hypothetical protein
MLFGALMEPLRVSITLKMIHQVSILISITTIFISFDYFASPALAAISSCFWGVAKESNDLKIVVPQTIFSLFSRQSSDQKELPFLGVLGTRKYFSVEFCCFMHLSI